MLTEASRPKPWRWIGTLYFAEGLPAAVVATLSTLLMKRLGVANDAIALYAGALLLPWSLRPAWSPLLEIFRTNRFFVVSTELATALALAGIAATLGSGGLGPSLCLFAFVAFSAATHDMAADGLFLGTLSSAERSR